MNKKGVDKVASYLRKREKERERESVCVFQEDGRKN